ncbi:MAG: ATP-binding cassette domain-containing protein [Pseudomonadota bacterium]
MTALLDVRDLVVRFPLKRANILAAREYLYAVNGVSFTVGRGKTLAIVGESGSGKTTTALAVARLVTAHSGHINLDGHDMLSVEGAALRAARAKFQFIFQDPYSSLNPRLRAGEIVAEPLRSLGQTPSDEIQPRVDELFAAVGLRPEQQRLFPHQFSGGQRQRLGIARALAPNPDLIICDEPVSALDVAVQAQILNLLRKLQVERGLTYLFISHDLGVVQHMCDEVAVMYKGEIVEHADRLSLFNAPQHSYTKALLAAVPTVDTKRRDQNRRMREAAGHGQS